MANYSIFKKILGLIKESTRGTAETTPTKWLAVSEDAALDYVHTPLKDLSHRGANAEYPSAPGLKTGAGVLPFPLRAQNVGEFLHMLLGDPSSSENAAFIVTLGTNDKINFTEDGGAEKTATLTAGSYPMGTTSATAGTLCALVKAALEAANDTAETYTVTYSRTTLKMTITKSSGVFVLKWSTGANAATSARTLLGFTAADTSSAIAATSNSTTGQWSFTHTWTPGHETQHAAYTFTMERGLNVMKYNLGSVSKIDFESSPDGFIVCKPMVHFQTEVSGSIGSPSFDESEELGFQHVTFNIADAENNEVKSWIVSLMNGLFPKRTFTQSQDVADFLAIKNEATGKFTIYFANTTERDKFLAGTTSKLEMLISGDSIYGGYSYAVNLTFDKVNYSGFPYAAEDKILAANVEWNAVYDTTNSRPFRVVVVNARASY